jgi:ATP phosphoribosyltransferase
MRPWLRCALPHKGLLADPSRLLLASVGYTVRSPRERLYCTDLQNCTEFVFLRARDIPAVVSAGLADVGITGRDHAAEADGATVELLPLGFGVSTVRYAVPHGSGLTLGTLYGKRVATALPRLAARHLASVGVVAEVVAVSGAVESTVHLGLADAVVDVVDSGRTLAAHELMVIGPPLLVSEAVLVTSRIGAQDPAVARLVDRLAAGLSQQRSASHRRSDELAG